MLHLYRAHPMRCAACDRKRTFSWLKIERLLICGPYATASVHAVSPAVNKFGKALCLEHQKEQNKDLKTTMEVDSHTKRIQEMVKNMHKDKLHTTEVELTDIKDWINSDIDTWKKALNRDKNEEYIVSSKRDTII